VQVQGVNCKVSGQAFRQDAYGNIAADGARLVCDGQVVRLVSDKLGNACMSTGKVCDAWLETVDFGRLTVKQMPPLNYIALFATAQQNRRLKKFLAPNADLLSASVFGDITRVKSLPAAKVDLNVRGDQGRTALMLACEG
jgi:hypothetical protein